MPLLTRPTLGPEIHPDIRRSIHTIVDAINQLHDPHLALVAKVNAMPAPLTLAQISAGLSASGPAPLNATGLVGATTPAPPPHP